MEAIRINEEDRLKFRVQRDHGIVSFFGSIGDTPDTTVLDGILLKDSICDMQHLVFASWIGLATLGAYIQQRALRVTFRNLCYSIFDSMRLNMDFAEQILESAELPLVNVQTKRVSLEMIDLRLLRKDAENGNEWVYPKAGFLLLLPTRYIFPDLTVQRSLGFLPVQVLTDQKEVASFWLQYGAFCQSTVEISNTLIHAAHFNMLQILGEIRAKVAGGERALKIIADKGNHALVQCIEAMTLEINREFIQLAEQLEKRFDECEQVLGALHILALDKGCELRSFAEALQSFASTIAGLTRIASTCEDSGANIGRRIDSLSATHCLKTAMAALNDPSPETLTALREAFAIMDIMSEDDWPASRELMMQEINTIEALRGQCVVTLQVFDMMRQILEHRIKEMGLVLESQRERGSDHLLDPELREAVVNTIGAQMVTEQEKAAFAFYLPQGFQKFGQTERKEPGDVLLF